MSVCSDDVELWLYRSAEWTKIRKSDRDRIGLTFSDDGEFWSDSFYTVVLIGHIKPKKFSVLSDAV